MSADPDTVPVPDRRLVGTSLVRRLIARQFPQWADLPVRPVAASGWDNQTFHLGDRMSVRLPTAREYALAVDKEHRWLPVLAPPLPLPIPVPLVKGEPDEEFAFPWSVYEWIDGDMAPGNLLVRNGALAAVIDFGTCGVGDPACDVAIAWMFFSGAGRDAFRARLDVDPGTWARGRGWALWKALIVYAGALPGDQNAVAWATRIIDEVLTDYAESA